MDKNVDLEVLGRTPYPRFGLRALVLTNYLAMKQARVMLWPWETIAQAVGLEPRLGRELGVVYRRVEKQIAAGKLKLPEQTPTRQTSGADVSNRTRGSKGFINLDEA